MINETRSVHKQKCNDATVVILQHKAKQPDFNLNLNYVYFINLQRIKKNILDSDHL